jgi:hypothetical protein
MVREAPVTVPGVPVSLRKVGEERCAPQSLDGRLPHLSHGFETPA